MPTKPSSEPLRPAGEQDAETSAEAGAETGADTGAGIDADAGAAAEAEADATRRRFEVFAQQLSTHGPRQALAYLLSLTRYRYIAIFRFQGGQATSALFYDRDDPSVEQVGEVPDTATYCCYVRDNRGVFTTADAVLDSRLQDHPARTVVPAYCGVPILDPDGTILGTLCHYDVVPQDPAQIDLMLMLQVASALAQGGHVPPYPYPPAAA